MSARTKTLIAVILLGIVDAVVLGVPVLALVLVYVILTKPGWFMAVVHDIYAEW